MKLHKKKQIWFKEKTNIVPNLNNQPCLLTSINLYKYTNSYSICHLQMKDMLSLVWNGSLYVSEFGFYCSSILALVLSFKLLAMVDWNFCKLTFVNKMLLIYFVSDSLIGFFENYFLFRIYRGR